MGLAGVKNKTKIGFDPRNTAWSHNTDRFGHQHLEKLGWKPGSGLGIGSSGQTAMTSHVKVSVKMDNTGLGKKSSKNAKHGLDGEITAGLDLFQRILGKLNGKDDKAVDKQLQDQRHRMVFQSTKFGMEFVYGGLLEGSIEKPPSYELIKHEKRKREEFEHDNGQSSESELELPRKRSKKDKKDRKDKDQKDKDKKDRKGKEKKDKKDKKDKEKEKKEKKEKKDKKEKKARKGGAEQKHTVDSLNVEEVQKEVVRTHAPLRGRQATRARYIAQKRAAIADETGLKEIFMITTKA